MPVSSSFDVDPYNPAAETKRFLSITRLLWLQRWLPNLAAAANCIALTMIALEEERLGETNYACVAIGVALFALASWLWSRRLWIKRQQALQELGTVKEFLFSVIENIADPVFVKDQNYRWVFANQRFYDMLGQPREKVLHKTDHDLLLKEQADLFHEIDRFVMESGEINENEEFFTNPEGRQHVLSTRKARFQGSSGQTYLVGIIRDMTSTRDTQDRLRLSEERLRTAQHAARFGLWDLDFNTGTLIWDEYMFRIFGIPPDADHQSFHYWKNGVHPEDIEGVLAHFDELMADREQNIFESHYRVMKPEGISHVQCHGVIRRDESGKALRVIGLCYDVTQTKIMETQLLQHKENLERLVAEQTQDLLLAKVRAEDANQAKSDFLSNMTHELRTPLNSIMGMTNLLKDRNLQGEERHMLDVINQASGMLYEVVNNILDISKIEAGQIVLEQIGFDFSSVVGRVISTLQPLAEKKNLMLTINMPASIPFLVGDPFRIGQVLTNLLSNAIKYTEEGSVTLHVSLMPDAGGAAKTKLRIAVEDTGAGIPPDKLSHIFSKFTQVDVSTTRRFGGSGLGLAICRELVDRMGGVIDVSSILGRGSYFWMETELPLAQSLHTDPLRHGLRRIRQQSGAIPVDRARLMVVEDHPLNQMLIRMLLDKYGFKDYTILQNGVEAVKAVHGDQSAYDLVLMDCFMPEMDGYEATRQIRFKEKSDLTGLKGTKEIRLPIVAITANAMQGDEEHCHAAGMDDYIAKPIQEKDFIEVLGQWLQFDLSKNHINQLNI